MTRPLGLKGSLWEVQKLTRALSGMKAAAQIYLLELSREAVGRTNPAFYPVGA